MSGDGENELRRLAVHEAGHAAVAFRLGRRLGPVALRPGGQWAGSAHFGAPSYARRADYARVDTSKPVPLWPASVRRRYEVLAMTTSAGKVAEDLFYWPGAGGYCGDTVAGRAAELAQASVEKGPVDVAPTRAEQAAVEAFHGDPAAETDEEKLAFWAARLYPSTSDERLRYAWLDFVALEARRQLEASSGQVFRLANALAEHRSLSGRAARELLAS